MPSVPREVVVRNRRVRPAVEVVDGRDLLPEPPCCRLVDHDLTKVRLSLYPR